MAREMQQPPDHPGLVTPPDVDRPAVDGSHEWEEPDLLSNGAANGCREVGADDRAAGALGMRRWIESDGFDE